MGDLETMMPGCYIQGRDKGVPATGVRAAEGQI